MAFASYFDMSNAKTLESTIKIKETEEWNKNKQNKP